MANQIVEISMPAGQARRCPYEREKGIQCKANAQTGSVYCFFHDPALDKERAAARKSGGIARTQMPALPADLPVKRLHAAAEIVGLLEETINQVRRGDLDVRVSNAIGYLSGILLTAIEKGSLEERLAALEAAVASPSHSTEAFLDDHGSFNFVQEDPEGPSCPK